MTRDRLTGVVLCGAGAVLLMSALQIRRVIPIGIGPGTFPIVLASLLGLLGLVLILRRPATGPQDTGTQGTGAQGTGAQGTGERGAAPTRTLSGLATYALLAAFTLAAFDRLGFVATGAIVVLAVGRLLGAGWPMLIAVAGIAPVVIHLVFVHAFSVPLPPGILDAVLP